MLRTRLVINSRAIGQNRAALSQPLFDVGAIKAGVTRAVQMDPVQSFAVAYRVSIGIAKSNVGNSQNFARLTIAAIVISLEHQ